MKRKQREVPLSEEEAKNYDAIRKAVEEEFPKAKSATKCELCLRENQATTEHHLIPRQVHGRKRFVKRFGKDEMNKRKVNLCKLCHKAVHELIPNNCQLADNFNTIPLLMGNSKIKRHVEWAKKQK